jgi:hypothetical protein
MNKTFLVETKRGRREWRVVRQADHDPKYRVGSVIPGLGKVIEVKA